MTPRLASPRRRARRAIFGLAVIGIGTLALLDNLRLFESGTARAARLAGGGADERHDGGRAGHVRAAGGA